MSLAVACPSCKRKLHVPEKFAGRRVTCPHCGDGVRVPRLEEALEEAVANVPAPAQDAAETADQLPLSGRLGVAALALGLLSVMVLCVPVAGYNMSLGLSGLGLVLSLGGLILSLWEGTRWVGGPRTPGVEVPFLPRRVLSFPLLGAAACLLALTLALLPFMTG
jgi:hypothetical protein